MCAREKDGPSVRKLRCCPHIFVAGFGNRLVFSTPYVHVSKGERNSTLRVSIPAHCDRTWKACKGLYDNVLKHVDLKKDYGRVSAAHSSN